MRTFLATTLAVITAACGAPQQKDSFLWLEEIEGEAQLDWVRAENARTLGELQGDPRYEELYQEALEILTSSDRIPLGTIRPNYLFNFWQDEKHVRGIWRRSALDAYRSGSPRWETLLDVDALAESESENWIFQQADCLAPDYDRCIINLSRGGSDASIAREFSVSKKAFVEDGFVTPEGKNGEAWLDADTLLVSSDWGEGRTESGYPHVIKTWKRGTSFADAKTVFEGDPEDVMVGPAVYRHGERVYPVLVRGVTFYEREYHWLKTGGDSGSELVRLPLPGRVRVIGAFEGRLIATLREPWDTDSGRFPAGSLVALRLEDMTAEEIFRPSDRQALDEVSIGKSSIFAELLEDAAGKAMRFRPGPEGWAATEVPMPANGVVRIAGASSSRDDLFLLYESLKAPQQLFYVSPEDKTSKVMTLPAFFDASVVVVEQHFATSRDGTRVPYFVMGTEEVLSRGNAPTVQYGYGGFLIPILPLYYQEPSRPQHGALAGKLWVSRGGVLVLSNIRGGGEYGPRWHEAALKENRQLAYDDFFAIAEDLIARGITSPRKLGAMGRSNGGLLMGVALTQRPDLYSAIDCGVPLFDMKRYNKLLAGASWMGEFGDPDKPEDWAYISKYSPYHNLAPGRPYPKVLFYTSTKDDRVHPGHARKAAAKLAELGYPFYYYENIEGGHGGTANQEQLAMRTALEYVYFMRQLMGGPAVQGRP